MKKIFASLITAALSLSAFAGESYNFFFISDTQFGDEDSFEMDQSAKWHFPKKGDPKRCALSMPKYESVMEQIVAGSNDSTFALIHGGNLLFGFAKTPEFFAGQFRKYLAFLKDKTALKVLLASGEHDFASVDGARVYAQEVNPFIASMIGREVDSTGNFAVWHGEDLFIFADYFGLPAKRKCDYLVKTLEKLEKKPRYLFVVIHPNIIQYPDKQTIRLRELLVRHNAIVLCGYSQVTRLIEYKNQEGILTQFSIVTFLTPNSAQYSRKVMTDKEAFFSELAKDRFYTGKDKNGKLRHDYAKEFEAEIAPCITRYWRANVAGFAEIKVSDAGVEAVVRSANPETEPLEVKIR